MTLGETMVEQLTIILDNLFAAGGLETVDNPYFLSIVEAIAEAIKKIKDLDGE